jgi:hypothetical protein
VQLERIAIALRPRSGWEAIDLGFRMAARWAGPVWTLWLVLFLPLVLALLLTFREQPALAALAIWWLKPVLDRFVLHVLAHAVFGQVPSLAESLAAWRSLLSARLWPSLLLRPFAWSRSFLAPVAQLERQRGTAARQRAGVLGRRLGGHVLALALVCFCFEWVTVIGCSSLLELLQPGSWMEGADESGDSPFWEPSWWGVRETLLYALAVTVIEPFFVAAGFSLYLSRRVMLEGWDIELGLRRLLARTAQVARGGAVVLLLGLLIAADLPAAQEAPAGEKTAEKSLAKQALYPGESKSSRHVGSDLDEPGKPLDLEAPIDAEAGGCALPDEEQSVYQPLDTPARRAVLAVLASPDFGGDQEVERWRARRSESEVDQVRETGWLAELGQLMASALRTLSWLLMAALVVALIWSIARRWQAGPQLQVDNAPPAQLFGLAISPDSLPSDVAAAARQALQEGRLREALSLLYRGALSVLVHQRGLRIGSGATEGDVLRLVQRLLPAAMSGYFERLLPTWVDLAYAHRQPQVEQLAALCAEYGEHFAAPSRSAGAAP